MTTPIPTSSRAAKKYVYDKFTELVTDYDNEIVALYGVPAQDNLSNIVMVGDITFESVETSSMGRRINVMEIYNIEVDIVIAQMDGDQYDVEQTAYDLFDVLQAFIRDDPTLGNNVDFVTCKLQSIQSGPGINGGAVCALIFNVECRKNLR